MLHMPDMLDVLHSPHSPLTHGLALWARTHWNTSLSISSGVTTGTVAAPSSDAWSRAQLAALQIWRYTRDREACGGGGEGEGWEVGSVAMVAMLAIESVSGWYEAWGIDEVA